MRRAVLVVVALAAAALAWLAVEGGPRPETPARPERESAALDTPTLQGMPAVAHHALHPVTPGGKESDPAPEVAFVVAGTEVPVPRVRVQLARKGPVIGFSVEFDGVAVVPPEVLHGSAGDTELMATAGGFLEKRFSLPRPAPRRLVVELEPLGRLGRFAGRVVDRSGEGIAGANVVADTTSLDEDRRWRWRTTTRNDGTFELRAPASGRLRLLFGGPSWLAEERFVAEDDTDLRVILRREADTSTLRMRVVDHDGAPVTGMRGWLLLSVTSDHVPRDRAAWNLSMELERGWSASGLSDGFASFTTDEDGWVGVPHRVPGTYEARGLGDGIWLHAEVPLGLPGAESQAVVQATQGRRLRGRVEVVPDPAWPCDHQEHGVYVGIQDWTLPTGTQELARLDAPGAFETVALPTEGLLLNVLVGNHPLVQCKVPPGEAAAGKPYELGTISLPSVRAVEILVFDADRNPVRRAELILGATTVAVQDGRARVVLPRPDGPLAVRARIDGKEVEVPERVDFLRTPVGLHLPGVTDR